MQNKGTPHLQEIEIKLSITEIILKIRVQKIQELYQRLREISENSEAKLDSL